MPAAPDVEVLIVSYDSAGTLGACLRSVEMAASGAPIAIREHGHDRVARTRLDALVASHPAAARVQIDESNPGFGAGCNALARTSKARWLLFLNPDAELLEWPWSSTNPPPIDAIVGPLMVESGPSGTHSGVRYRVRDEIARSWMRRRGQLPQGRGFVSGAALLIDRASFERVGGFDERYFLFYEDIDLCLRANEIGIATHLDERWMVRHAGAHSTRRHFGSALIWSYESAVRFHGRTGGHLVGYRFYVVADASMRATVRLLRRDRSGATAYVRLAQRAATDLFAARSRPSRL